MDTATGNGKQVMMVKVGSATLTGLPAAIMLVMILALFVGLIAYMKPSVPMLITGGLWITFIVYWSAAAKNSAAARSSESQRSRQIHEMLLYGGLLMLFLPLPGLGWRYLPPSPFNVPVGLAVQIASGLLAVWSRHHLGRNWSVKVRIAEDHQLVRTGPYRLIRHPIYTAMLGMSVGTAVVSGQLHALIGVAMLAIAYSRKIGMEERILGETFGPAYEDYRRDTWALIPWVI